ncbi:MAG: ATP-binding protein [Erysipelotrichales bacterium]|nr:MAG: ATP-binding protein [Erysipelotrichales bacterium]
MMQDFAMHLLDLAHNSVSADATRLTITIDESPLRDRFKICLEDNGCGMNEETVNKARSPFYTSRTTRRIGMGIPLLEGTTNQCNGTFTLASQPGNGTLISGEMPYHCIDRPPLGDVGSALAMILQAAPMIRLVLEYTYEVASFCFDSDEIHDTLGDEVRIDDPTILLFIRDYVQEHIHALQQGGKSDK